MKVRVNAYGLDQTDVRCHAVVASALFLSLLSSVGTGFFVFSLAEVLLMLAFCISQYNAASIKGVVRQQ